MGYCKAWQERIAAGLCAACGAERVGTGSTKWRCAACSEKVRESNRRAYENRKADPGAYTAEGKAARRQPTEAEKRDARRAAGVCTRCGGARGSAGGLWCGGCRAKQRGWGKKHLRKTRLHSYYGEGGDGTPLVYGGNAPRLDRARFVQATLDVGAMQGLRELMRQDTEAQRKAAPEKRPELRFRISRLVRAAIQVWEVGVCPTRKADYRKLGCNRIGFWADARTLAVIERHQAARDGNVSATVCDLIAASGNRPRWVAKASSGRGLNDAGLR